MARRLVFTLSPLKRKKNDTGTVWVLRDARRMPVGYYHYGRAGALRDAAQTMRDVVYMGDRCELRVRRLDGTIGETRTYPRSSDPRRSKG